MRTLAIVTLSAAILAAGCARGVEIPTGFPTPPPIAAATPLPKLDLRIDAELGQKLVAIAVEAKGKVGVAAVVLETGEAAMLNANQHFPMQSVYKLPIALAVVEQVRLGKLDLDEIVGVTSEDMVRAGQASPLRDAHPKGGEFSIRDLIRFTMVESDGTASDVLLRAAGGPAEVQYYLAQAGVADVKVINSEKEIGRDWQTQYANWATPLAAVELLRRVNVDVDPEADEGLAFVKKTMTDSTTGPRRSKGLLPQGTVVFHKTGTSGTQNGVTAATNDIGIITLPNGRHAAVAVFVSDSPADEKTREAVIAKIAKAVWDRFGK